MKNILKASVAAGALVALAAPMHSAQAAGISQAGKLDLKIGGRIVKGMGYYDDSVNGGTFFPDGQSNDSELYFTASGKLTEKVTAGINFKWDLNQPGASASFSTDGQNTSAAAAEAVDKQFVYFKHADMGTLSLGFQSEAGDGAQNLKFGQALATTGGFARNITFITNTTVQSAVTAAAQISNLDGGNENAIRYDSPAFAGFTLSASGHDDSGYSVALRYSGAFAGLSVDAAGAYNVQPNANSHNAGGSIRVKHDSGLHAAFALGTARTEGSGRKGETKRYHGGYEGSLNSLGKTDFYVTFVESEDIATAGVDADELIVGATQALDAIGGYVGVAYSTTGASDTASTNYADIDVIYLETGINF